MKNNETLNRLVHWTENDVIECATYYPDHNVLELHFTKNNETKPFYVESSVWLDLLDGKDIEEIYDEDVLGVFAEVAEFGDITKEQVEYFTYYKHYIIDKDDAPEAHFYTLFVQASNGYDKMLISDTYCYIAGRGNDIGKLLNLVRA